MGLYARNWLKIKTSYLFFSTLTWVREVRGLP